MSDKAYDPLYHKNKALDILKSDKGKPLVIYRPLIHALGYNAAIVLSNLIYWSKPAKGKQSQGKMRDPDGWIYKDYDEWKAETFLERKQVKAASDKLVGLEVIEKDRTKINGATPYLYRITSYGWEWIIKATEEYDDLELAKSATSEGGEEEDSTTSNRQDVPDGSGKNGHMEPAKSATSYNTKNTSGNTSGGTSDGEGRNVQSCTPDPPPPRRLFSPFKTLGALDPYYYGLCEICKILPSENLSPKITAALRRAKKEIQNFNSPPTLFRAFLGYFCEGKEDWEGFDGKPNPSQVADEWCSFIEYDAENGTGIIQKARAELPEDPYDLAFVVVCNLMSPVVDEHNRKLLEQRRAYLKAIGATPEDIYFMGYQLRRTDPGKTPDINAIEDAIRRFYVPLAFDRLRSEDPDYLEIQARLNGVSPETCDLTEQLNIVQCVYGNKEKGYSVEDLIRHAEKRASEQKVDQQQYPGKCKGKKNNGSPCRMNPEGETEYCEHHQHQSPEYKRAIALYMGIDPSDDKTAGCYADQQRYEWKLDFLLSEVEAGHTWESRTGMKIGQEEERYADLFADYGESTTCCAIKRDGSHCYETIGDGEIFCDSHRENVDHGGHEVVPCKGTEDNGQACKYRTRELNGYCQDHQFQSSDPANKRCVGKIQDGSRCSIIMKLDHPGVYCGTHKNQDPEQVYIRAQAAKKARKKERTICKGITRNGVQCSVEVAALDGYCHHHKWEEGFTDYEIAVALFIDITRSQGTPEERRLALEKAVEGFRSRGWTLEDILAELQAGYVYVSELQSGVSPFFRGMIAYYYELSPQDSDTLKGKVIDVKNAGVFEDFFRGAVVEGYTYRHTLGGGQGYSSQRLPS